MKKQTHRDDDFIQFDLDVMYSLTTTQTIQLICTAAVITNNGDVAAVVNGKYLLTAGANLSFAVDDENIIYSKLKVEFVTGGAGTNPRVDIAQLSSSKFINYAGK